MKVFCDRNTIWVAPERKDNISYVKQFLKFIFMKYLNTESSSFTLHRIQFKELCDKIIRGDDKVYKFTGITGATNQDFEGSCPTASSVNDIRKEREEFPVSVNVKGNKIELNF